MTYATEPLISVITPSLNHARFLRETIESVAMQKSVTFEHIIIDGGSTDDTLKILKDYSHVTWVSEPDAHIVEAYEKGFRMARGKYVIQCCVSDGFLDQYWFSKCAAALEKDDEISLVWGFPQSMSEDGNLLNVSFQDFFVDPPPQKRELFPFWLATGLPLPEGNYCVRREVVLKWFPGSASTDWFRICPHLGFMYNFFTQGYSAYFISAVANYGRTHQDQRSRRLIDVEKPAQMAYKRAIRQYRRHLLHQRTVHYFRDGYSRICGRLEPTELWSLRRAIWRHSILRSRILRLDPCTLVHKVLTRYVSMQKERHLRAL